jgi:hypothetical protein
MRLSLDLKLLLDGGQHAGHVGEHHPLFGNNFYCTSNAAILPNTE